MTTAKTDEAKPTARPEKKGLTDSQRLAALIKAAKANGWSLPKEFDEKD